MNLVIIAWFLSFITLNIILSIMDSSNTSSKINSRGEKFLKKSRRPV